MNAGHFSKGSPGQLVEISTPRGRDWAFVPHELPLDWGIDHSLWPLIAQARESLGTLNGIGQTLKDYQLLLRPLQNREAISSSNIEGTYITPEQLILFELNPNNPSEQSDRKADWQEVANYGHALHKGCELLKDLPICNRVIRSMHNALMQGVRGKDKRPGEFRNLQVQITYSGRFIPPPANEVIRLMDNLETYINSTRDAIDPLVRCFLVHYQFETIHPFSDGNGRVGRALLALMIYHWHKHTMPWLYMSSYLEQNKDEYFQRLYDISTKKQMVEWIKFCLNGVIQQANDSIDRCHRFNRLKIEFHKRIDSHSPRTHDLIEQLFVVPIVRISGVAKKHNISYPTAKSDIDKLIKAGILKELIDVFPKSHFSPEIMDIAYREKWVVVNSSSGQPNPTAPPPPSLPMPPAEPLLEPLL